MKKPVRSAAWLLIGFSGSKPGLLTLGAGKLRFETADECLWDIEVKEIDQVVFPWYYFGGGMKVQVGKNRYRLSFLRPNTGESLTDPVLCKKLGYGYTGSVSSSMGDTLEDMKMGRQAGKVWKEALAQKTK